MNKQSAILISVMLDAYPHQESKDMNLIRAAFEIGCEDFTDEAIQETCKRFIKKKVKRNNLTFAPSVEEFVGECEHVTELQRLRALPKFEAIASPEENYTPPTAEQKKKVQALVDGFTAGITEGDKQ